MVICRNILIVLGVFSAFGIYLGLSRGQFDVVTIMLVALVMCVFLGIYCHEESKDV